MTFRGRHYNRAPVPFEVTRRRLLSLVPLLSGRRIVVAGDFVLDRFVYGHPRRVSREAPVVILRFSHEDLLPGGAGNAAANVRSLGGEPLAVGIVGADEDGRALRRALRERGIEDRGLVEEDGYRTPAKTRILGGAPSANKQQIVRYDVETEPAASAASSRALQRAAEAARGAAGAMLSDYGYGAVGPEAVSALRGALPARAPIAVDSRHMLRRYAGVDAATPNEEELEEVAGTRLLTDAALDRAAEALRSEMGCASLLVTRGSRGMALYSDDGAAPRRIPVHGTDQVADVTGAGDTVLAVFSLALAAGASPLEAALLADFAGGVVVMKMGTATVTAEELRDAIESDRTLLS
jgi:rfaE bifunctional protein kinase chain/domain